MSDVLELDAFQLDTLRWLDGEDGHVAGRAVIADPMGARKTATTLAWLERTPDVRSTLVVAPSVVHKHWFTEASTWHPYAGQYHGVSDKNGRPLEALKRVVETASEGLPALYVTTYESMKIDQRMLEAVKWDAVVFDEGHRLKGRRTQVALCGNAVTKRTPRLIFATGTPVLNHAAELWQYLHMLDPKTYTAFWRWAEEHYRVEIKNYRGNRFPTRIIHDFRPGHEEIVRAQIAPYFIQRELHELFPGAAWIEEPEHVEIAVDLSPKERKAYDSLVKHKWAIVEGKEVTTQNSLDLNTRLLQITSEWGALNKEVETGTKVKATMELLWELLERDEQVVVFAKFKDTVARIVEALGAKGVIASTYTGDTHQSIKDTVVEGFNAGRIRVVVGTLDSMSEGVDGLQAHCNNIVMVDRHWTPGKNDQAIGRLRRSGQTRRVIVWHVFANGTLDAVVTKACLRKVNVIQVLKGMPLIDAIYGRV